MKLPKLPLKIQKESLAFRNQKQAQIHKIFVHL